MQYNQSFCGNGFTNGPFYNCCNAPLQSSQSIYPEIVGEGEVTSMSLPDGTVHYFFMPTVKWWSPNLTQCHPNIPNPMQTNRNFNIPLYNNNNIGTWFVRSISNPFPQNMFNMPCQRSEAPKLFNNISSDCNIINSNGYQLKFHNDNWTSTTDLYYFYPSLRQHEYVIKPSNKGTAMVQVETVPAANTTMCHYEVVCNCKCNVDTIKPMSLVSIVEPKKTKSNANSTTDCSCEDLIKKRHPRDKANKSNNDSIECSCDDILKKRYKQNRLNKSNSNCINCSCDDLIKKRHPRDKANKSNNNSIECSCDDILKKRHKRDRLNRSNNNSINCSCDDIIKKHHKRERGRKKRVKKSKCACPGESTISIPTANKSVTTYADQGSSCTPPHVRETQTCLTENQTCCCQKTSCEKPKPLHLFNSNHTTQRCEVKTAETWKPKSSLSKKPMARKSSENLNISENEHDYSGCSSDCSCFSQ